MIEIYNDFLMDVCVKYIFILFIHGVIYAV